MKYSEREKEIIKWLNETDEAQFSTMELIDMYCDKLQKENEELKGAAMQQLWKELDNSDLDTKLKDWDQENWTVDIESINGVYVAELKNHKGGVVELVVESDSLSEVLEELAISVKLLNPKEGE